MTNRNFNISWTGRCQFDNEDKLWGWFKYTADDNTNENYTFWTLKIGKTIHLTKFTNWDISTIDRIRLTKIKNGYKQLSLTELEEVWPNFMIDLENKFIWDKLSEKI